MLEVTPHGDQHPKDFVIKSDNAEGEIDRIKEILKQAEVSAEDHLHQFFHGRPVEEFQQGVILPSGHAVDLADLTEGEPGLEPVAGAVTQAREQAFTEEPAVGGGESTPDQGAAQGDQATQGPQNTTPQGDQAPTGEESGGTAED